MEWKCVFIDNYIKIWNQSDWPELFMLCTSDGMADIPRQFYLHKILLPASQMLLLLLEFFVEKEAELFKVILY